MNGARHSVLSTVKSAAITKDDMTTYKGITITTYPPFKGQPYGQSVSIAANWVMTLNGEDYGRPGTNIGEALTIMEGLVNE